MNVKTCEKVGMVGIGHFLSEEFFPSNLMAKKNIYINFYIALNL